MFHSGDVLRCSLPAAFMLTLFVLPAQIAVSQSGRPDPVAISEIQGASHLSPLEGEEVTTQGVVTAVGPRGFYMESTTPDDDPATSEGIYVYTYRLPTVAIGDLVEVAGRVSEDYPGGRSSGNLPITTVRMPELRVLEQGVEIAPPTVIGTGGRIPPSRIITNDADGLAEESPFDPCQDGLDFYESLEGMRVRIDDALSVGTVHTAYGEIWVVPNGGAHASGLTARGGIAVREGDFNPERILVDYIEDWQPYRPTNTPRPVVGDLFLGSIEGVMSYSFYNYKVLPTAELPAIRAARLPRETAAHADTEREAGDGRVLSVAAFNVENLSGESPQEKFDDIAATVVDALGAPDLVLLSEIQDSDGAGRSDDTSSAATASRLLAALEDAGSPGRYEYVDIAPEYNADGGRPHANIRVGFLYREDRIKLVPGSLRRIAPEESPAFVNSRKPLVGEFEFALRRITAVAVHFASKSGDGPLFGRVQPPTFGSEAKRWAQAEEVRRYVEAIVADDPEALVIVGGDFNDFAFSQTLCRIAGDVLTNPADALESEEVYSYVYEGNSQALDHILLSRTPAHVTVGAVDYVHRYAEYLYGERQSDHDPVLVRIRFE